MFIAIICFAAKKWRKLSKIQIRGDFIGGKGCLIPGSSPNWNSQGPDSTPMQHPGEESSRLHSTNRLRNGFFRLSIKYRFHSESLISTHTLCFEINT